MGVRVAIFELTGKTVLVTGGSRGLGLALSAEQTAGPMWKSVCEALGKSPAGAAEVSPAGYCMVLTVAPYYAAHARKILHRAGEKTVLLGHLRRAERLITCRERGSGGNAG